MKFPTKTLLATVVLVTGAAIANGAVQNEAVKKRQAAMSTIGDSVKVLGGMAKGAMAFDAEKAGAAVAAIATQAEMVPALFEPQETDPESEAKPEIWANWDDFTMKSEALLAAAQGADTSSLETLQASLGKLGGACKDCHTDYRIEKN